MNLLHKDISFLLGDTFVLIDLGCSPYYWIVQRVENGDLVYHDWCLALPVISEAYNSLHKVRTVIVELHQVFENLQDRCACEGLLVHEHQSNLSQPCA